MTEPWYRRAFREEYSALYAHRDEDEAEQAIRLLARLARLSGERVLDLACGEGRHARALARRGARVLGLDLSAELIRRAAKTGPVLRGDMRSLPFRRETFGGVVNMFTSFGYFEGREENEHVLEEVSRVLRPSGWLFLDYVNAESVLSRLVPVSERRAGERRVREIRSFEPRTRTLTKEIQVLGDEGGPVDAWVERLTLFTPGEIEEMLAGARFLVRGRFGEYDGRPVEPESARVIFFCVGSGRRS